MVEISWDELLLLVDAGRPVSYKEESISYTVYVADGINVYFSEISKTKGNDSLKRSQFNSKIKNRAKGVASSVDHGPNLLTSLSQIKASIDAIPSGITALESQPSPSYSYSAGIASYSVANSATDVFIISGSSTKVVKIKKIGISFNVNPTVSIPDTSEISLVKRSSVNAMNGFTALSKVPHDSLFPESNVTVGYYESNPSSLGTSVGVIRCRRLTAPDQDTTFQIPFIEWSFENHIVLRSMTELLAVNYNGNTLTTDSNSIYVEWEES